MHLVLPLKSSWFFLYYLYSGQFLFLWFIDGPLVNTGILLFLSLRIGPCINLYIFWLFWPFLTVCNLKFLFFLRNKSFSLCNFKFYTYRLSWALFCRFCFFAFLCIRTQSFIAVFVLLKNIDFYINFYINYLVLF